MEARPVYVQRAYVTRGGRAYYSRTFYREVAIYVGLYRGYGWGGHMYYGYYPRRLGTHPDLYGWGYHPWELRSPGALGLGDGEDRRGIGFYGGWWNPYPAYAAPYYWLTD